MRKRSFLALLGLGLVTSIGYTCDEYGITGIVEDNDLNIGIYDKSANKDMTEEVFNQTIDRVENVYKPIVRDLGGRLQVIRKWSDGTVNAYAQRSGSTYKVSMFGGLARHATITPDGFAMVVCHEIGHHIGGAPKKGGWFGGSSWASNEGQADYWGAMKCMRRVFKDDNNEQIVASMTIPELVKKQCADNFTTDDEQFLCQRVAMAGKSLAYLFQALRKLPKAPDFATPDPKVVNSTDHNHPQPQCRLDTYYNGGLCDTALDDGVSQRDPQTGVCTRAAGYDLGKGARPLCWYKPKRI